MTAGPPIGFTSASVRTDHSATDLTTSRSLDAMRGDPDNPGLTSDNRGPRRDPVGSTPTTAAAAGNQACSDRTFTE